MGFFMLALHQLGGFGFIGTADFADHDHGIGVGVVVEGLHHVDVLETVDRVATNAHGGGLAQADFGQHGHGFVRQRARTRHHTDAALAVNVARHDADLDFVGRDDAGAVGAQQQRLLARQRLPWPSSCCALRACRAPGCLR
jgi:hypothetical protein